MMKDLLKEQYSLPTCRVLEIQLVRVIAASTERMVEETEDSWDN